MTRPDNPWFRRTFKSGSRVTPAVTDPVQLARLVERAHTLAEAVTIARAYERKGADAGTVRLALDARFTAAYNDLVAAKGALEEPPAVEAGGLLERDVAPGQGAASPPDVPLTSSDVLGQLVTELIRHPEESLEVLQQAQAEFEEFLRETPEPQSLDAHRNLRVVE